jgi:hypothetical protein
MNSITKHFKIWAQAFALIILFLAIIKLIEGDDQLRLGVILQIGGAVALFLLIDMSIMSRINVKTTRGYITIELSILLPCYLAAGWIFKWYDKSAAGFMVFLAAFFGIYTLIFAIQRQQIKTDAQRINEKLKEYVDDSRNEESN